MTPGGGELENYPLRQTKSGERVVFACAVYPKGGSVRGLGRVQEETEFSPDDAAVGGGQLAIGDYVGIIDKNVVIVALVLEGCDSTSGSEYEEWIYGDEGAAEEVARV